ncbi:MAG: YgaP family membrane protein [Polyangiales bacterium]
MFANEGFVDRFMRVVLGIALIALVFFGPKTLWGLVGIVPLLTGAIGFCPLYRVVGLSTHPRTHTLG